ncbi:MAG: GGDEF domain-containing protein, partial [Solirubrobacteraceae bacterium]
RVPGAPGTARLRTREAAPAVAGLVAVTALLAALGGGGEAAWLCLPAALLAAARCRTRVSASIAVAAVAAASWIAADAVSPAGSSVPAPALLLFVVGASAAVLVAVREQLAAERDTLREFALRDSVTQIANRRSLLMRADYEIERHRRNRRSFALVMLDLDGFKQLNDRFGHAAGDDLLRDVADGLSHSMRAQDTVARLGGDEFCVLAPETGERGSQQLANKVVAAVHRVSVGLEAVSGSAGVAIFPADGATAEELLHAADVRLLEAKRRRYAGRRRRRAA